MHSDKVKYSIKNKLFMLSATVAVPFLIMVICLIYALHSYWQVGKLLGKHRDGHPAVLLYRIAGSVSQYQGEKESITDKIVWI